MQTSDDAHALISDRDLDQLADAELTFRRHWAADLGLDPQAAHLDALLSAERAA